MIERVTMVSCERGCEAFVIAQNSREAKREAKAQGWSVSTKHGDYCPECVQRDSQEKKK